MHLPTPVLTVFLVLNAGALALPPGTESFSGSATSTLDPMLKQRDTPLFAGYDPNDVDCTGNAIKTWSTGSTDACMPFDSDATKYRVGYTWNGAAGICFFNDDACTVGGHGYTSQWSTGDCLKNVTEFLSEDGWAPTGPWKSAKFGALWGLCDMRTDVT